MLRTAVLADDLTGALTSATEVARRTRDVQMIWRTDQVGATRNTVTVANMQTRDLPLGHFERAKKWTRILRDSGIEQFECRMDSTLSGKTFEEVTGILAALDEPRPVIAIPAYPDAGRITRDGVQLVKNLGQDRYLHFEIADQLFRGPADLVVSSQDVRAGTERLSTVIDAECSRKRDARIIIDADRNNDFHSIAAAIDGLVARHHPLTISPGAWLSYRNYREPAQRTLVVIASPTDVNISQMAALADASELFSASIDDAASPGFSEAVARALDARRTVLVSTHGHGEQSMVQRSEDFARDAARTAVQVMTVAENAMKPFSKVVVSGGFAAEKLVELLEPTRITPIEQIGSMCSLSILHFVDDRTPVHMITKGGQMGDTNTLVDLVELPNRSPLLDQLEIRKDRNVSVSHSDR